MIYPITGTLFTINGIKYKVTAVGFGGDSDQVVLMWGKMKIAYYEYETIDKPVIRYRNGAKEFLKGFNDKVSHTQNPELEGKNVVKSKY